MQGIWWRAGLAAAELTQLWYQHIVRQLFFIAAAKLKKAVLAVAEPNPELRAWSDVFHPIRQVRRRFPNTSRPQSIDQYP
jgi:hypothetical protein